MKESNGKKKEQKICKYYISINNNNCKDRNNKERENNKKIFKIDQIKLK